MPTKCFVPKRLFFPREAEGGGGAFAPFFPFFAIARPLELSTMISLSWSDKSSRIRISLRRFRGLLRITRHAQTRTRSFEEPWRRLARGSRLHRPRRGV